MPTYEFADERGDVLEIVMPAAEAPRIGETLAHEGKHLTRIVTAMPQTRGPSTQRGGVVLPNVTRRMGLSAPQYRDRKGQAAFSTDRKVEDYAKRNGMEVLRDGPDRCQQIVEQTERFERERATSVRRDEARARSMSAQMQAEIE